MSTEPQYTEEHLLELIALAKQLQFWDDVRHWEKLLKELRS